jgi:hypothetical protein
MSLLNQNNNKGKKKGKQKNQPGPGGANSKFIPKQTSATSSGFKSKQKNTGAQRGS